MVSFFELPLNEEILQALVELEIDYVFQPIFYKDGKKIFAYEALMRPKEKDVLALIDEYETAGKLHVLEVATFFGAVQAYKERGYEEFVCINSFPSECFTEEENRVFNEYFGEEIKGKGIIEILESPEFSEESWESKKNILKEQNLKVAIDDFGTGNSDMEAVDILDPHIVKLDRSLFADIHQDEEKQRICKGYIADFHSKGMQVLAEGVETKDEFEFLQKQGVDLFQGFYLARPA